MREKLSPDSMELTADQVSKAYQDSKTFAKELSPSEKDAYIKRLELALTWSTMKIDAVRLFPRSKEFTDAMFEQAQKNKILLNLD